MSYDGILGWGVLREEPWHLVGIYRTQGEARLKLAEMGPNYIAVYGEGFIGTDDFLWTQKNA